MFDFTQHASTRLRRLVKPQAEPIAADPDDAGMLDVVGFDAATPQIITDFAA